MALLAAETGITLNNQLHGDAFHVASGINDIIILSTEITPSSSKLS